MLRALHMSSGASPRMASTVSDVIESSSRALIVTTAAICAALYMTAAITGWDLASLSRVVVVSSATLVTAALALCLLSTRPLAAQIVWLVGLGAAILWAIALFHSPEVAYFLALLPFTAVLMVGWPAGLITEVVLAAATWWLGRSILAGAMSPTHGLGIVASGAALGLLGWAVMRPLLSVADWALSTYEQGQRTLEQMRGQRLELKQAQEDLLLANAELARLSDRLKGMYQVAEEARRAKEEFVANVSHELRTPLNMIIGFSELIPQLPEVYGDQLPPTLLADIAAIRRNSQHLAKLVDDVLDLSQIEAGRMALQREWTTVPEIIEGVSAARPLFESKGLYLQTEVAAELPPLLCDVTRVRQVLLNLVGNAGRFTKRGGVTVRARQEKNEIVVSVADTGPGISQQDQERLFQPFQQLDGSLRRRHGGSGLGLSISKRLVEMHGGRMWMQSEVGVGTTVLFSLPLGPSLSAATAQAPDARRWFGASVDYRYRLRTRPSKAPTPVARPRYVVLEEGDALQRLMVRYLPGAETVAVRSMEEAVRELRQRPAQALIANEPPSEARWVRGTRPSGLPFDTPLISCWVPSEGEAARRLGVMRYLLKPVTREGLLSALTGLGREVERILLVDDSQEAVRLFSRMLASASHKYHVLRATSGQRALSLLREGKPDVMLLDLIMPGMDGFQVLREKSEDPAIRGIPVVIISSRDPGGGPIVSDALTVSRTGGLSARELLDCIQATSDLLAPPQPAGREPPGMPHEPPAS